MEVEDDEDLKLVKASGALLDDLEKNIPRLLWKPKKKSGDGRRVHQYAKRLDCHNLVQLVGGIRHFTLGNSPNQH